MSGIISVTRENYLNVLSQLTKNYNYETLVIEPGFVREFKSEIEGLITVVDNFGKDQLNVPVAITVTNDKVKVQSLLEEVQNEMSIAEAAILMSELADGDTPLELIALAQQYRSLME